MFNENLLDNLEISFWRTLRKSAPNKDYETQYKACELGKSFKKLSPTQQIDFDYYKTQPDSIRPMSWFKSQSKLYFKCQTLEQWYWLWDTHGIKCSSVGGEACKDFKNLGRSIGGSEAIMQAKEFTNLTIKMWVEDHLKGLLFIEEVKKSCNLPWMWTSFLNQLKGGP